MKRTLILTTTIMFILSTTALMAQDKPVFQITDLTENLHLLTTDQGAYTTNSIVFDGDDGLLLIDTQSEAEAEELKKIVDGYGRGIPKYIINTHRHVEHIGGNAVFGTEPIVITHALYPEKLKRGSYIFNEFPEAAYPDITVDDSLTLTFNGETIRIIALGGSHDDNEIIVHFTQAKIVHLSSLVNGFNFPSIDADGDVLMFAPLIARAIELLPEDVTIISGHNDSGSWNDLHAYHDMLIGTAQAVKAGLDAGKDLTALQEENVLEPWKSYAGSYVGVNDWIEYLVEGYETGNEPVKKTIFEPIYYALKDGGVDAGVKKYLDIKNNHGGEYEIDGVHLLIIGNKLFKKKKLPEAIRFLELALQEFPADKYAYYTHYRLAQAYRDQNDKQAAIKNCKKAIELNAEFEGSAILLEELKKM